MKESHHPDGEDAPDVDYEGEEEADAAITPPPPPDGIDARPPPTPPPGGGGAGDSETEDDDDDDDDDDDAGPRPPVIRGGDPAGAGGRGENGEIGSDVGEKEVKGGGGGSGAVAARGGGGDVESSGKVAVAPPSRMDCALDAPREAAARGGGRGEEGDDGHSGRRVGDRHGDRGDRRDAGRGATTKRRPPGGEEDAVGAYIPPAKRRLLEEQRKAGEAEETTAASSASRQVATATPASVQRRTWEDLRRLINGTINRLSPATIKDLIHSLFSGANLVRGRGLLASSVLRASSASPRHAPAYAALMAVVSSKLPECGELLLARAILAFRRGYKRRDRDGVSSTLALLGHLFNQGMAHELLSLQILTVLLDGDPTEDSVDVAVGYMCVVGRQLAEVSPAGVHAVMERFRGLLHEGSIGRRAQYRIETLLRIRKGGFADYPTIPDEEHLDLVEREDQITFELGLDDEGLRNEEELDSFHYDDEYDEREEEWKRIKAEILGEDSDGESGSGGDSGESGTESEDEDEDEAPDKERAGSSSRDNKKTVTIEDLTETDLVHLRRTIYLTIMSSATFEECTHKLAKMDIPPGRECELINMIIECCSQERTFLRYYGMVSGRFCLLHERWQNAFEEAFATQYNTIHRLETNKLRNVAKLFGHLLHTDSFSWSVLGCIHLNEDETTSSSRIFIKILVQEMAEAMGMVTLKQRFDTDNPDPDGPVGEDAPVAAIAVPGSRGQDRQEPSSRDWFRGMFPKDNARNTRYAINFFTSIGLGPLTDGMREFLKNAPKLILAQVQAQAAKEAAGRDKDDDESSVISTSSSDTSSASSSSSGSSMSSSSSSSYTSSSSNSSYSSFSRKKSKAKGGRDRKRSGRRSRSYSSYSSSDAGRKKYSSRDKRGGSGGGRRRGRASSDGRDGDSSGDDAESKATSPDTGSNRRSVSVSFPRRDGRKVDNGRGRSRRSPDSSSRSRSRSRGGDYSDKRRGGNGRDERRRKSPPASSRDKEERSNQEAGRKKRARSSS